MFPYVISMSFELYEIFNINFERDEYGHFGGIRGFFVHINKNLGKITKIFCPVFFVHHLNSDRLGTTD